MRKLDFIVFGSARSGTTAMAEILSASHQIYCGVEVFHPQEDHSRKDVPDAFFNKLEKTQGTGKRIPPAVINSIRLLEKKNKDIILSYGNKYPMYYTRLAGVLEEIGSTKSIMCFRDFRKSAESYHRNATTKDHPWPAGRGAFYAGADAIVLVKAIAAQARPDMLVVPQSALAKSWKETASAVTDYILPGTPITYDAAEIAKIENRKQSRQKLSRPEIPKEDAEILDALDFDDVSGIMSRDHPFLFGDVIGEVRDFAKTLPDNHVEYVRELSEKHPSAEVREFFPAWVRAIGTA